ncbi:MAG: NUDIX domain-containing protein [Candidatus Gracilibacteria bacterium]|nr:NUDIX domain-containing protein [Candidatus Gracilibacteria bacterium]
MARIYEKSSGGIVYRKKEGNMEVLLLEWLNSKGNVELVIPKGHIEEGEIARVAAVREISEEAGLQEKDLEVIKFITKLNYTFTAAHLEDSPLIDKDVYLFLIRYNGNENPVVQKEERFVGYKWVSLNEIKDVEIKFDLLSIISKNKIYFI